LLLRERDGGLMRAQSSLEAIALFASATLILTIFMMYFGAQISEKAEQREFESLRDLADTIRQEVLLARQAGPGYERTLIIPSPGSEKRVVFTIEYPPGPGVTELTVRFDPPLNDAIEASEILGEGVYGYFTSGTNTIETHPGGIIVEPDPVVIQELRDGLAGFEPPTPEIAFAYLGSDTVRITDEIECEYGVANADGSSGDVDIAWISRDGFDEDCTNMTISSDSRAILTTTSSMIKGHNLSCAARYHDSRSQPLCFDLFLNYDGPRIARSSEALIVNSPPRIEVDSVPTVMGDDDPDTSSTSWSDIPIKFAVSDDDHSDQQFNITLIKDGTNANYIECGSACELSLIDSSSQTMRILLTVPWPEGESAGCSDINRLSFKLSAIEADGTSELYTVKTVDATDALRCQGDD
jgi:hypothetical protein